MKIGDHHNGIEMIGPAPSRDGKHTYSLFRCSCGKEWTARNDQIKSGSIKSCGASIHQFVRTTHGMARTREYRSWASMLQRCRNEKSDVYHYYGGRGITVCAEWHDFQAFYADMGPRPAGMTLDRIDNNRGYFPGNCRWATKAQQMRNVRNAHSVSLCGEPLALNQARVALGLGHDTINLRRRQFGETPQQTVNWFFANEMVEAAIA